MAPYQPKGGASDDTFTQPVGLQGSAIGRDRRIYQGFAVTEVAEIRLFDATER